MAAYCSMLPLLALLVHLHIVTASRAESCELAPNVYRMEVLPGIGWDNLRNKEMALVFEYDYSSCQLTNDGKLLLPDGSYTTPVKKSNVEIISQLFDHWSNYTSMTSASINIEGHSIFSLISGKFSAEHVSAKTNMYNHKSFHILIQIRQTVYRVNLQPGTKLHPMFKQRLLEITTQMTNNNTDIAHYMSELLIRDYGTHYITAVHAGGILALEDYVDKTDLLESQEKRNSIRVSAAFHFSDIISFVGGGFSYTTDQKNTDDYFSRRTSSYITTYGGPPYKNNFTVDYWENGLDDNLVAIDREGIPLHFAIIPEAFPELPPTHTMELANYIEKAINSYYKHNTHYGCTDPNAENFYFAANIDDGSCKAKANNYTFGGVYQITSPATVGWCNDLSQKNPKTNDFTCPSGYTAVRLHSGSKSITQRTCKKIVIFKHCSDHLVTCNYQMYWCVATGEVHDQSGYLFGGTYNSIAVNPLTKTRLCPHNFYPLKLGLDAHVCVSDDYDLGSALSVPFAGFISCASGNPLALNSYTRTQDYPEKWPERCPKGYSQHLAVVEQQSCEINYCTKTDSLDEKGLPPVKLPPFRKYPSPNTDSYTSLFTSFNSDMWIKNKTTLEWKEVKESGADELWHDYLRAIGLEKEAYVISNSTSTSGYATHHNSHY
ncbi:macrophage-expressed gene 1 protein-like [Dysidea avara]|uniref:macrophage-expressed gene 1 protein-like n=1 Tax=Dysidea avara TaxID=196820 RepID=UPI00332720CD